MAIYTPEIFSKVYISCITRWGQGYDLFGSAVSEAKKSPWGMNLVGMWILLQITTSSYLQFKF